MYRMSHRVAKLVGQIGILGADLSCWEVVEMSFKFFNTFLGLSLKLDSTQAFCAVLFEYRQVGSCLLKLGSGQLVLQIVRHMKYYSDAAQVLKIKQASEMVAYDVSVLLTQSCGSADHAQLDPLLQHQMLQLFLSLDKVPEDKNEESILRGIRKAQMKLAAYYLFSCSTDSCSYALACEMRQDMLSDPMERLESLRDELISAPEYSLEVQERGFNVEYTPVELYPFLDHFVYMDKEASLSVDEMHESYAKFVAAQLSSRSAKQGPGPAASDGLLLRPYQSSEVCNSLCA